MSFTSSRRDRFPELAPELLANWAGFPNIPHDPIVPDLVGLQQEEIRENYCRLRLPWRPELAQPAGVMHGGAIATLIDTVVVPAVAGVYPERIALFTIDLQMNFLAPIVGRDAIAEGWTIKRGRSIVFCQAEVFSGDGTLTTTASLTYKLGPPLSEVQAKNSR